MIVNNVDYSAVAASPAMYKAFQKAVRRTLALEPEVSSWYILEKDSYSAQEGIIAWAISLHHLIRTGYINSVVIYNK